MLTMLHCQHYVLCKYGTRTCLGKTKVLGNAPFVRPKYGLAPMSDPIGIAIVGNIGFHTNTHPGWVMVESELHSRTELYLRKERRTNIF